MFNWKLAESPLCTHCNHKVIDTPEHHLFSCDQSVNFWRELQNWILINLELGFNFTIWEVLFGIIPSNNDDLFIVNYLLLLGKWFINNKKSMNRKLIFGEFMPVLKNKPCIISNAYNVKGENDKFQEKLKKSQIIYEVCHFKFVQIKL